MIRDSVQSSAGLLKVHIFRCFQKICLILCNSDIIFRIRIRDGLHLSGKGAAVLAEGLSGAVASGLGKVRYLN